MDGKIKGFKLKVLIAVPVLFLSALLIIAVYSYTIANYAVLSKAEDMLDIFTDRIVAEMKHLDIVLESTKRTLNEEHISIAIAIEYILDNAPEEVLTPEELHQLAEPLNIIELNVVNEEGILTHSNDASLIGFNYNDFESTSIYMGLVTGELHEITEDPRRSVLDGVEFGEMNHYTGIPRRQGGFIQLGFNAEEFGRLQEDINIAKTIREIFVGETGFGMVISEGIVTACYDETLIGKDVSDTDWFKTVNAGDGFAGIQIDGIDYYAAYKNTRNNETVVGIVTENEIHEESRDLLVRLIIIALISVCVLIPVIYLLINGFVKPVLNRTDNPGNTNN